MVKHEGEFVYLTEVSLRAEGSGGEGRSGREGCDRRWVRLEKARSIVGVTMEAGTGVVN